MHAFTLIELMIVIAIVSTIAAIAIPNLLESKESINESAAAINLKSDVHPAQMQFYWATYSDLGGDGRGEYARDHEQLAGAFSSNSVGCTSKSLALLPPIFNVADRGAVGAYLFQIDTDVDTADAAFSNAETFFGAYGIPSNGGEGRRAFAVNVIGSVFASKQTYSSAALLDMDMIAGQVLADNTGTFNSATCLLASDSRIHASSLNPANVVVFQK